MKLVTAKEIRALEAQAMTQCGIPSVVLMENAGLAVVAAGQELVGDYHGKRVVVLAGSGNNGGDGFVVARHVANRGGETRVFLVGTPEAMQSDTRINYDILMHMGVPVQKMGEDLLSLLATELGTANLIVDALYGTGFAGQITGLAQDVVHFMNAAGQPILAVDVPSGLIADTGEVLGPCVQATTTVTFGLPKIGLYLEPGARYAGTIRVADISLPRSVVAASRFRHNLITREWCQGLLPARSPDSHKGTFGRVLAVGGSPGMTGAVSLAAEAALRSGAGLVAAALPRTLQHIVAGKTSEVITHGLADVDGGHMGTAAAEEFVALAGRASVVALGMGLGRHEETFAWLRQVLPDMRAPLILDADALTGLAGHTALLTQHRGEIVVTPHPGEMSRLTGLSVDEIQRQRVDVARRYAVEWQCTVVLKGARTVVADPGGEIYLNQSGNPGMATAGMGDVLAGVISALMAHGLTPSLAAALGVYAHGTAGDAAARAKGFMGLTASDVLASLPEVWRELGR
ncbi:MAG: Bifunctional NAD(P)H-hydrate repair enzyme Nnr [Firmicutes bacterium]|nr:Bifunctional NAD(P)H-hydrate repair enzyme Nnr [candidate division NPL-UPA2 bacterium]MBT9155948.1 Bifunctional NAD(P)H-hydrate repair enzyme Nnr [candidate division NPL-UPA2 bacterium]